MRTKYSLTLTALIYLLAQGNAFAQFKSGSTGTYGPMNITTSTTLDVPSDGVFNCTTITISSPATLSFRRNSGNTPVYLLATGDVKIDGSINVDGGIGHSSSGGQGGPGGFDGGSAGNGADIKPGSGGGPGGGKGGNFYTYGMLGDKDSAGSGSYRTAAGDGRAKNGIPYGSSLLIPLIGGSGGGGCGAPTTGGGGGGGAILISSNTSVNLNSSISAIAGPSPNGYMGGSGGAIRIVAPIVSGNGSLLVSGYANSGEGRTRVDCQDRSSMNISGVQAVGSVMVVTPSPLPKLSITQVAGKTITEGSTTGVDYLLPSGTSPNQTISVRARDFGQAVPIRITLLPENGDPIYYDVSVDNTTTNPADLTTNITVPVNQQVRIQVWTR